MLERGPAGNRFKIANGRLSDMAALCLSDGMDADSPKRRTLIANYVSMIKEASPLMPFNAVRLFVSPYEMFKTGIMPVIANAGFGIVADTINAVWKKEPYNVYVRYINNLYAFGVNVFYVDDCHRFRVDELQQMIAPLAELEDTVCVLSCGSAAASFQRGARTAAILQTALEVQLYVSDSETGFVRKWTTDSGMAVAALGCYAPKKDAPLPSLTALKSIFANLAPDIPNVAVYGHTEYTDFRKQVNRNHWKAICQLMDAWRCRKQPAL